MKYSKPAPTLTALLAAILLVPVLATGAAGQGSGRAPEVLTNESIIQMFVGKVPKDLILTKIKTTKSTFDITPAGLIALNTSKVPNDVTKLMMTTAAASAGEGQKEVLNNEGILKLVAGQLSKDIIITKIHMSKPDYDLTTSGLINLNQNKVSQDIIKAMMAATSGTPTRP